MALAEVERALAALGPHLRSPEDMADLSQLQAATSRLARRALAPTPAAALGDFDPQRFQRLLELTGPSMAGALLTHLADDLTTCRSTTTAGAETQDWIALREGSHVLISLAGSVGALSLQGRAEALNGAAHMQDGGAVGLIMPDLLRELDALIDLVRSTPAPAKTPQAKAPSPKSAPAKDAR